MNISRLLSIFAAVLCLQCPLFAGTLAKPRIEVFKAIRELRLYDGAMLVKSYHIALGSNPVPRKEQLGDRATPEGAYYICEKNPLSRFHLSLGISYPGPQDARRGLKSGLISKEEYKAILLAAARHEKPPWNTRLGGTVYVHGNGCACDWTWGCIALNDPDIEELYRLVPVKTPITIHP